jgi:hypothetical protein
MTCQPSPWPPRVASGTKKKHPKVQNFSAYGKELADDPAFDKYLLPEGFSPQQAKVKRKVS